MFSRRRQRRHAPPIRILARSLALAALAGGGCSQTHVVLVPLGDGGTAQDAAADAADAGDARTERVSADGGVAVAAVSAGDSHACGIMSGALYCWGANDHGQLGLGDRNLRAAPVRVGADADWAAVAASTSNTIALKADGSLWAWGANDQGQLGTGTATGPNGGPWQSSPVRVGARNDWSLIASRFDHSCAIAADHSLWCWGDNVEGQLGQNDSYLGDHLPNYLATPTQVAADRDWSVVDTGQGHSCGVRSSGTLWCWGRNTAAQLGQGGTDPQQIRAPVQVGTDSTWVEVQAGQQFSCGLRAGALSCWGESDAQRIPGAPSSGSYVGTPLPIAISGAVVRVSINSFGGFVITRAGAALGWGRNAEGQLGLGDTVDRPSPTMIASDGCTQVSAGPFFTCGVRRDAIYCTGDNKNGQLGLGDTDRRSQPQILMFP